MKTYVLYHGGCWDGFCAAWVAHGVLRGDVEYIPVQYEQDPPAVEQGSRLYILDFSYDRGTMLFLAKRVHALTVLDHHKTAQEALQDFADECVANGLDVPHIVFDMGKSGARLAWEHFRLGEQCPWLVRMVEDRDLWKWELPHSREVNAAIRSYPMTWDTFDWLAEVLENGAPEV
jgi:oligoribonuclease NrnB/cAMP/cGMP phosphodiesterase (DHH superfamily)